MKTFHKAVIGSAAAAAMAVSATPAMANDRDHDGIGAGEIIAGALIIGGIAAIAASSGNDRHDRDYRDQRYDRDYRGYRGDYNYGRAGYANGRIGSRQAVSQCVRAAEIEGRRYGRFVNVTDIRDIDRTRNGYRVEGRVTVGNRRYADDGRFTCRVDYGRVSRVTFRGL